MSDPFAVIPDSNVLIHARALHQLPWEIFREDDIEVLLVGQVIRELDLLKTRPGRPGRIAREISRHIRILLGQPDQADVIRESNPRVTRRLRLGRAEARAPVRPDLDLTRGDQVILNEVLTLVDQGRRVVFLTDDTYAAALAAEYGIPCRLLPEDWLRPEEGDESQKTIARLKAENARLQAAEPLATAHFTDEAGNRIVHLEGELQRYVPLELHQIDAWLDRIAAAAPAADLDAPPARPRGGRTDLVGLDVDMGPGPQFISAQARERYLQDHDRWLHAVRSKLSRLHETRRHRQGWPLLSLVIRNDGVRPAEGVIVKIEVRGNLTLENPKRWREQVAAFDAAQARSEREIGMPPRPPEPTRMSNILSAIGGVDLIRTPPRFHDAGPPAFRSPRREADAFYWREGRDQPGGRMVLECETWMHQREADTFGFRIGGTEDGLIAGVVEATLEARNLAQPLSIRLPVRIQFVDATLEKDAEAMVVRFERAMARARGI